MDKNCLDEHELRPSKITLLPFEKSRLNARPVAYRLESRRDDIIGKPKLASQGFFSSTSGLRSIHGNNFQAHAGFPYHSKFPENDNKKTRLKSSVVTE